VSEGLPTAPRGTFGRLAPWLIAAVGVLVYANSLDGVFLFDDHKDIVENDALHVLWPPWVAMGLSFRQLVYYSFAINHAISCHETWSYHLVNGALHILAALTLFGLVRRTLRLPRIAIPDGRATGIAWAVALLWTVHPLNTQAVVYVVQRAEVACALAYLLTLYCFVRAIEAPTPRRRWLVATVLAFFTGLSCKEVIATAPLSLFLFDAIFVSDSFREALRRRWALYAVLCAPFLLVPVAWLIVNPERFVLIRIDSRAPDQAGYFLAQGRVIVEYVRLAVWPAELNLDHGWDPARHTRSLVPAFALVAVVFAGAVEAVRRRSPIGWVGLTFFLVLAPSSSLFPLVDYLVEHRMYPALAPLIVALVLGVDALLRRVVTDTRRARVIGFVLLLAAVVPLGWRTVQRNGDYASREGMWRDVIAKSPRNPRAHYNLGLALLDDEGRESEALEVFRTATRLHPGHRKAHHNLGAILLWQGEIEEAARHLRTALSIGRKHPFEFLSNYGNALLELERHAEAAGVLERALDQLTREPENRVHEADLQNSLGLCYAALDDGQRAVAAYRRAVELDPRHDRAQANLLRQLTAAGRTSEAVDHAREVVRTQPDSPAARRRLAAALAADGRIAEAIDAYVDALGEKPGDVSLALELTRVCVQPGNREIARERLERVAEEHPANADAARILDMLGQLR
jgi:tetratricopeptide (TPR) repeat protein